MAVTFRRYAGAGLVIVVAVVAERIGTWWWSHREWFDLQAQQLAMIERLGNFPPVGVNPDEWRNALVTPCNVWGNVTFHPEYSQVSNEEMRSLKRELDLLAGGTTPQNSFDSVDRVFRLLLQRGRKIEFISAYRDEFRGYRDAVRRRSENAERAHALAPAAGPVSNGPPAPPPVQ